MHFIEFVEAIARVAEKVTIDRNKYKSPPNKGEISSIRNSSSTRKQNDLKMIKRSIP